MANQLGMKLMALSQGMAAIPHLQRVVELNKRRALEYVLAMLVNYAKKFGPYIDRSSLLRKGINWRIETIKGEPIGIFYADRDYAIHVELKDGYWVLSGALEELHSVITGVFGEQMKVSSSIRSPGLGRATFMRFAL